MDSSLFTFRVIVVCASPPQTGAGIQPVSCRFKLSLWRQNTDIEICRPETRARNWAV